mmetsp:Transcript_23787/g.30950  ORF Transcript_23787/g.30950 Transcript_23787/m.30950 type:complete len:680 (-) Transcript_23787:89-2128(-)
MVCIVNFCCLSLLFLCSKIRSSVIPAVKDRKELELFIASEGGLARFREWPNFELQSEYVCNDTDAAGELVKEFLLVEERYKRIAKDSLIGAPPLCPALCHALKKSHYDVTVQSLYEAEILRRYEMELGDRVSDYDLVLEMFGGSGLFAGRIHESGLWLIYDFSILNSIQRYALERLRNHRVLILEQSHNLFFDNSCEPTIALVADLGLISDAMSEWCYSCVGSSTKCRKIFLTTKTTFSDIDSSTRAVIEDMISNFDAYALIYKKSYVLQADELINNDLYFSYGFRQRMENGATISRHGKVRSLDGMTWSITSSLESWFIKLHGIPTSPQEQIRLLVGKRLGRTFVIELSCNDLLYTENIISLYAKEAPIAAIVIATNQDYFRGGCEPIAQSLGTTYELFKVPLSREFICIHFHVNDDGLFSPYTVKLSECSTLFHDAIAHARNISSFGRTEIAYNKMQKSQALSISLQEKNSVPNKPYFIHIQKTAGASISEMFGGHRPPDPGACIYVLYGLHDLKVSQFLKGPHDRVLLSLRDPADRVISFYNYLYNRKGRDYFKDLNQIINEGTPGSAQAQVFTMEDLENLRVFIHTAAQYSTYFDGIPLSDSRIHVFCVNNSLEEQVFEYARRIQCKKMPTKMPKLHKATHDNTVITDDLRQFIYRERHEDKRIFDYFCSSAALS